VVGEAAAGIPATAVLAGAVEDFVEGEFKVLQVNDKEVGVYRARKGGWFAVRNFCPHRGAPVCSGRVGGTMLPSEPGEFNYGMDEEVLRCPWHAMEFSLADGRSLFGASKFGLTTYQVFVRDSQVWVDTRRIRPDNQGANTA
jgi:nitrite reductase (NADH) small subunit